MFVDLHIHSYFSDGAQTPEEAARLCRDNGVGLAALCDHNSWLGTERFADACHELGVTPVRGVEMDCNWKGLHLHILGYRFTPTPELAALAHRSRELLLQMSEDLIAKMAREYPALSPEEYSRYRYDARKGGWAGLHYLVEKGVTATPEQGMPFYKQYGLDYSSYPFPDAAEVIAAIVAAGGVPVLAHPCNYFAACDWRQLYAIYDALCALGLQGCESYYPGQSKELTLRTAVYCERNGLISTSGSDCHGNIFRAGSTVERHIGCLMAEPHQLRLEGLADPTLLR